MTTTADSMAIAKCNIQKNVVFILLFSLFYLGFSSLVCMPPLILCHLYLNWSILQPFFPCSLQRYIS